MLLTYRVTTLSWVVATIGLLVGRFLSCGCNGFKSRYAMSDPVYATNYAEGAERGVLFGKAKQAVDARHVAGLGGWFVSGGTQ